MKSQLGIDRTKASPPWNSTVKTTLYQSVFHRQGGSWQLGSMCEGIACSQECFNSAMEFLCGAHGATIGGPDGAAGPQGLELNSCACPKHHQIKLLLKMLGSGGHLII